MSSVESARVAYAGAANSYPVKIVGDWLRGEITMVMSASSGPKYYIKNMIAGAFEANPGIERIRMVMNERNVPFCLFQVQGRWFDCSAKEVVFSAN